MAVLTQATDDGSGAGLKNWLRGACIRKQSADSPNGITPIGSNQPGWPALDPTCDIHSRPTEHAAIRIGNDSTARIERDPLHRTTLITDAAEDEPALEQLQCPGRHRPL